MKRLLVLVAALTMALTMALPASSITNGEPTTEHSEVVLILMDVGGEPAFRCSGTLMSPTIVVRSPGMTGAPGVHGEEVLIVTSLLMHKSPALLQVS